MSARYRISPERRESLRQLAWRLDTPVGLAALFGTALLLRVLLAPHFGFYGDLRLFQRWAGRLDEVGPGDFYVKGQFADYPPGYLYVLWLLGKISATPGYLLLKLPAILADLGLAWVSGTLAARIAPGSLRERVPVRTLVAAAVLFNPAVIALSAIWGQVDAVPAFLLLTSLLLLFTGPHGFRREIPAFLLFAVVFAMKPQAGFVLPVMLYALYRRYLHRRPRAELIDGALSIAFAAVLSLGLWAVSGLAFGLGPVSLVRFYSDSASVYPVTSANAFNLWGAVGFWRLDSADPFFGDAGPAVYVAGISAAHLGMLAFLAAAAIVLWRMHRSIERGAHEARMLVVASAALSLLAYALLTRMHERYMFPALACLGPLVFVRQLRLALGGLSALFILNLWYPYAFFNSGWGVEDLRFKPWFDWLLGGFETDTWQKKVWSLTVVGIVLAVAWFGLRWAELAGSGSVSGFVSGLRRPRERASHEPVSAPASAQASSRWAPLLLVGLACLFSLVILHGETRYADNLNDGAFHQQMVRWANGQIGEGRVPLDGWYPYLSLGSAQFHHYQSLPHTLTAYTARATGASDQGAYLWIQYFLLALWPISVYLGARLLGWRPWTAASAAALSPLVSSTTSYGYEHSSYTWQGYGVYSQLWAMWLMPIAWGLTWRAVAHGRRYAAASAALALTVACHFITGYLAILTVGVWVLVLGRTDFVRRVGRAALTVSGAVLVAAWVLVPLVGDTKWTTRSEYYQGTFFNDSYGARRVLEWLVKGKLFDAGRFPVLTILVFAGLLVCATRARADPRARALLGAFALSLLLFFGRPTLGPVLDLLPGVGDIQIHRFLIGVHLTGILLAGAGLAWLLEMVAKLVHQVAPGRHVEVAGAAMGALAILVLAPAWTERAHYDKRGVRWLDAQRAVDATEGKSMDEFAAFVNARHDGRAFAGLRGTWGREYLIGQVPVYADLANRDVDAIGFTFRTIASLSTDVEAAFDETNPAQYEMFNVRYLVLPADRKPSVPAKLLLSSGRHRLYRVATSGYLQVVDRAPAIEADRTNLRAATAAFMGSDLASRGIYPGIAFAGAAAPPPTFEEAAPPAGPPGRVRSQTATLQDGVFTASVEANRPAVVLLKASYDRRWTATVDGLPAKPTMMAPSLVGVEVPTGKHRVRFEYEPYAGYPVLLSIGLLTLLGLALVSRREALLRFARSRRPRVLERPSV